MIEKIKEAIKNDSLVLFVGAGMSMPLKFPSWTDLILNILKDIDEDGPFNFSYYLKQANYIDVFKVLDELERNGYVPKVKKALHKQITPIKFEEPQLNKHKKLWEFCDKIITTNYDKVLEKVMPEGIEAYSNGNEFQQSKSIQGSPFLYKIHGDITNPNTCILFESDYKKLYNDTSDLQTLKSFLLNKTILFIGFSLDDPFVTRQMEHITTLYKGYNPEHYILQTKSKDFSDFNVKSISIENWEDAFDSFLDKLIVTKKESLKTTELTIVEKNEDIDISKIDDIVLLKEMLEEKKLEFRNTDDSKKRAISKDMHSIITQIQILQTKELQLNFLEDIPEHKEGELEHVFETIFESEKLTPQIILQIDTIRDQHSKNYEWYHRSVIVSALACSLVNHKKVDPKKIDLLIDFTNDSEEKVWQKAITYLFFILNHLRNKWLKFKQLKPKLEQLKSNTKIQEALKLIITSLQIEAQKVSPINDKIFNNDYFKNSPFNYFLPFYEGNPSIEKIYEDETIVEIDEFISSLHKLPLPDSLKYLFCNGDRQKGNKKLKPKEKDFFNFMIDVHFTFEPYLNYINEFLNFYKNFPGLQKELKQTTTIIGFKNFKNHLLSSIEHHRAMARQFMLQKDFEKAIMHYEKIRIIETNDEDTLVNLSICYEKTKKGIDSALKLCLKIEEISPKNHKNLNRISRQYRKQKKFKLALKYSNLAIDLNDKNDIYYYGRFISKFELKNYQGAIDDCNNAIELNPEDINYVYFRGVYKGFLEDFKGAIKDFESIIKSDNKDLAINAYSSKANVFRKMNKFDEAFDIINEALTINNKKGVLYGTKATIYSSIGNQEQFYNLLEKSFQLKAEASWLDDDIIDKYNNEARFKELLSKYNQVLEQAY